MAIFDSVIAGQVGGGLRWGNHVIGGDASLELGAAHLHQFTAEALQLLGCRLHRCLHLGIKTLSKCFLEDSHPQAPNRLLKAGQIVGHRHIQAGGIAGVMAGNYLQHRRRIGHRAAEGAHLVEGTGKGHQAPATNAAIGGF